MRGIPFFAPALGTILRGYRREHLGKDLGAGLAVGIIALPLAVGFGIASGATPGQGLWTAIIGGSHRGFRTRVGGDCGFSRV